MSNVPIDTDGYILIRLRNPQPSNGLIYIETPWPLKKSIKLLLPDIYYIEGFESIREATASKLESLFLDKPHLSRIRLTDPQYSNIISALDHNIICKCIFDVNNHLVKNIVLDGDSCRYTGFLTINLIKILKG